MGKDSSQLQPSQKALLSGGTTILQITGSLYQSGCNMRNCPSGTDLGNTATTFPEPITLNSVGMERCSSTTHLCRMYGVLALKRCSHQGLSLMARKSPWITGKSILKQKMRKWVWSDLNAHCLHTDFESAPSPVQEHRPHGGSRIRTVRKALRQAVLSRPPLPSWVSPQCGRADLNCRLCPCGTRPSILRIEPCFPTAANRGGGI